MSAPVIDLPSIFGRADQPPARAAVGTTHEQMAADRLRIAFGVNDTVIRHLFSIGLSLHTTREVVSGPAQVRLDSMINELDLAISELRSLIFDLACEAPRNSVNNYDRRPPM